MTSLTEVQVAYKQGNKTEAVRLLKTVLQTRPSADAWVMAARLTNNPETAKQHLQRALAFDPKHIKARDMLRSLGGNAQPSSTALTLGFLPALQTELEKFGANRPVLKNLSPKVRMITAVTLFTGILITLLVMVKVLLSADPVPVLPEITSVAVFEPDMLISQWSAAGLNVSDVKQVTQEPEALSTLQIAARVDDGVSEHTINIFLYPDVASIVNDGARMTTFTTDGNFKLGFIETAIIVYPSDMNQATVDLLINSLSPQSSAPLSA